MSDFVKMAEAYIESCKNEPIRVLVWGPGDPGPGGTATERRGYKKRVKIRDEIKKRFPLADIHFSEDKALRKGTKKAGGELLREAVQAKLAHIIIMLDISRGVDLEFDHFVKTYSWFRPKVHLFLPDKYLPAHGLVKEVIKLLAKDQVEGFSKTDFQKCTLATIKAVAAVHTKAVELSLAY